MKNSKERIKYIPIKYREFYDIPRLFIVRYCENTFLFVCEFDEYIDDYSNQYNIYKLKQIDNEIMNGDWNTLYNKHIKILGNAYVNEICFDETKRKGIEESCLINILKKIQENK